MGGKKLGTKEKEKRENSVWGRGKKTKRADPNHTKEKQI